VKGWPVRGIRDTLHIDAFPRTSEEFAHMESEKKASSSVRVEISPGELLDKIVILRIKADRIHDADKLRNVRRELDVLNAVRDTLALSPRLAELEAQLREVNERLWDVEDALRARERDQDFGPEFVELARSVYHNNDRRAALKRAINELLDSPLIEEKSYTPYSRGTSGAG
jgi:hypothetical protein